MTCVGSKARLWIFDLDIEFLIPFVLDSPGLGLTEKKVYIEISEQRGHEIKDGLDYIKRHPKPPTHLLRNTSSPRPANTTLPTGWHASEVELLDAQRQRRSQDLSVWSSLQSGPGGSSGPSIEE